MAAVGQTITFCKVKIRFNLTEWWGSLLILRSRIILLYHIIGKKAKWIHREECDDIADNGNVVRAHTYRD